MIIDAPYAERTVPIMGTDEYLKCPHSCKKETNAMG